MYACTRQVEIGDILDAKHGTDRLRRHTPADKALALKDMAYTNDGRQDGAGVEYARNDSDRVTGLPI